MSAWHKGDGEPGRRTPAVHLCEDCGCRLKSRNPLTMCAPCQGRRRKKACAEPGFLGRRDNACKPQKYATQCR